MLRKTVTTYLPRRQNIPNDVRQKQIQCAFLSFYNLYKIRIVVKRKGEEGEEERRKRRGRREKRRGRREKRRERRKKRRGRRKKRRGRRERREELTPTITLSKS